MSRDRKASPFRASDPSLLIAAAATVAFYAALSLPALHGSLIQRYATEHLVEYVIVALFFWGITDVVLKLLAFPREILASRQDWLPPRSGREPAANAQALLDAVRSRPAWQRNSRLGRRLEHALGFVAEKGSAEGFSEHLRYLADQDDNQTHSNYTLIRFVVTISPILGFLGTVVHFGTALGGLSFEDMSRKVPEVAAQIGTAFDTTATALATGMTMTFALFLCERVERRIVAAADRFADRELLNRFEARDAELTPFLAAVRTANQEALESVAASLREQTQAWSGAVETLFRRFDERQREEADRWQEALEESRQRGAADEAGREERFRRVLAAVETREDAHMARIEAALDRATAFREEIAGLLGSLDAVARGEGRLAEVQETLAENLRLVHQAGQIDAAIHELTAAIHLLTARDHRAGRREAA